MHIANKKLNNKYFLLILTSFIIFFGWKFFAKEKRILGVSTQPKQIILNDTGFSENIETNAASVEEFLNEQDLILNEIDLIYPEKSTRLFSGLKIKIQRAKKLTVAVDGLEKEILGFEETIEKILIENSINFKEEDIIEPAKNTFAYNDLTVKITRVEIKEETEQENIAFKTIEKEDNELSWRTKKTKQEGVKGIKEIKYEVAYHDGEEVSRKIVNTEIIKDPVEEIVTQGTYVKLGKKHTGQGTWYDQSFYPNLLKKYPFEGNMFAANPWLPMGSYVKVTNTANGKSIIVRINDRGPFGDNRIIDLNKIAFAKIASIGAGVINVKVEEITN